MYDESLSSHLNKVFTLSDVKVDDVVKRIIGTPNGIEMDLRVTKIDDKYIYCGSWIFSKKTGAEIDPDLGWDDHNTGSYIRKKLA